MLKKIKRSVLGSARGCGIFSLVQNSKWRRDRLLILAYHGIALSDEHRFNGSQFISADLFRDRLELLRKSKCAVLPLGEAVERLYADDLPDRAVAITFDDGLSDFYRRAFPVIREFDARRAVRCRLPAQPSSRVFFGSLPFVGKQSGTSPEIRH